MNFSLFHLIYTALLPTSCVFCDSVADTGWDICHDCYRQLPHNHHCCKTCAFPLPGSPDDIPLQCGGCLTTGKVISQATIPYLYRPPADFLVKRLKFGGERKYGRLMGNLLADAIGPADRPDFLVPVPQHRDRYLERGFNQAASLAHIVGKRLSLPVNEQLASRVIAGPPQSKLNARDRQKNVQRAFRVEKQPQTGHSTHVAIVDDVYTTGATSEALAAKLQQSGIDKISIWAFARTPGTLH